MSEHGFHLEVRNDPAAVSGACLELTQWLAEHPLPPEADYLANLAFEELLTNCIKYGYRDDQEGLIEFDIRVSGDELLFTIRDDGAPFNPMESPEPEIDASLEERRVGGLGIHLLRRMSDRMEYSYEDGRNVVTLYKRLTPPFDSDPVSV
jgi:anti-sigma regulatory factor (Ser/Thr protein kinase)